MHVHKLCLRQFSGRSHCSFLCHCFVLPTYYTCASHLKAGGIEYGLARAGRHSPPPLLPSLYGAGSVPSSTFERKRRRPTTTQCHKQGWGEKDLTATAAPSRISPNTSFPLLHPIPPSPLLFCSAPSSYAKISAAIHFCISLLLLLSIPQLRKGAGVGRTYYEPPEEKEAHNIFRS